MASPRFLRPTDRFGVLSALLALTVTVALLLLPPHGWLDKADRAAFAVCHRIAERTIAIAGRPLPLCARCSGTYLGALAGLVVLLARGRGRSDRLPGRKFVAVFAIFVFAWAADGVNSFLTLLPGLPHLYEPHNLLRLVTGALEGTAIAAFMLPVLNLSLWARETGQPSVGTWGDLAWMLVGGIGVVGLVGSQWAPLLYPLAIVSGLAVVVLLGAVNAMLALILVRREGRANGWRQVVAPCLLGVSLALVELMAIGAARAALAERFDLPY